MILEKMIKYINSLKPSAKAYTDQEKVKWINDVEAKIKKEIVKNYTSVEIDVTDKTKLDYVINSIKYEDIVDVYFDGKKYEKLDYRDVISELLSSEENATFDYEKITIVAQSNHIPYRYCEYVSKDNEVLFNPNEIIITDNYFNNEIVRELKVGDFITITGATQDVTRNKTLEIKDIQSTKIIVGNDSFVPGMETEITIKRFLNDELFLSAPYDEIYCYYATAKIDFLDQEYEAYNNTVILYEKLLSDYKKIYVQNKPDHQIEFKNFY